MQARTQVCKAQKLKTTPLSSTLNIVCICIYVYVVVDLTLCAHESLYAQSDVELHRTKLYQVGFVYVNKVIWLIFLKILHSQALRCGFKSELVQQFECLVILKIFLKNYISILESFKKRNLEN